MNEMRCYVTITGGDGKKGSRELYDLPVELEGQRDVLEAFVREHHDYMTEVNKLMAVSFALMIYYAPGETLWIDLMRSVKHKGIAMHGRKGHVMTYNVDLIWGPWSIGTAPDIEYDIMAQIIKLFDPDRGAAFPCALIFSDLIWVDFCNVKVTVTTQDMTINTDPAWFEPNVLHRGTYSFDLKELFQ